MRAPIFERGRFQHQARVEFRDVLSGAEPKGRSSLAEERRRPAEAGGVAAAKKRPGSLRACCCYYPRLHEVAPRHKARRGTARFRVGRTGAAVRRVTIF